MKKQKAILFLFISTIIFIASLAYTEASIRFYKPDNSIASQDLSCTYTCALSCPSNSPNCCNQEGQYYVIWDTGEGGITKNCRPATTCNSDPEPPASLQSILIVDAQNVNWDTSTYCTSTCSPTGKRWVWDNSPGVNQCCGDDATDNPDWSQVSCERCPMNPTDVNNTPRKWNVGSGEVALTTCCGDDAGEYYQWTGNSRSCDGTVACCDNTNDYVLGGICVAVCPDVTNAYFNDMAGNAFNPPAYIPNINDYVMMIADLQGVADGTAINFKIQGNKGAIQCYTKEDTTWTISSKAALDTQIVNCTDGSVPDSINFTAYIQTDPSKFKESGSLQVDPTQDNSPPYAVISNPLMGDLIPVGQVINFVSGSYDIDDPISSYLWDLGDSTTSTFQTITHSYSSGGPRTIILTVTDKRGLISQDKIGILIDDAGQNDPPLAFISKPKYGERFSGLLIDFDASLSRDDIKAGIDDLIFTWEFDDGYVYTGKGLTGATFTRLFSTGGEHTVKLKVDDADPVSEVQTTFYIEGCQVNVESELEYIPEKTCSPLTMHYFCEDQSTNTYYDTLKEQCQGRDGIPLTVDDCCPRGYYCPTGGAMPEGACQVRPSDCTTLPQAQCASLGCIWLDSYCADPANLSSCSDYPSSSSCAGDILGLGLTGGRGLGTEICGRTIGNYTIPAISCKCTWDSVNSVCKLYYESNYTLGGTGFIQCKKVFSSLSNCLQGKQILTWTATCTYSDTGLPCGAEEAVLQQCSSGQKEIKCATAVSKLNFFNFFNLLAVLILLAFYYYAKEVRLKHKGH